VVRSYILGQFAAFPGQPAQRVLATINPATGAINRLPALPAGVVDHWRVIEPGKERIVMLGNDGTVYIYNASPPAHAHHSERGPGAARVPGADAPGFGGGRHGRPSPVRTRAKWYCST
jgi:hypothetical protein